MSGEGTRPRSIDLSVDVDAAPEAVWAAISGGEGLSRWFSPVASSEPGEGGSVTVSWGPGTEWTSRIAVWKPCERLRLVDPPAEETGSGTDGTDASAPGPGDAPPESALDYWIEPRGRGARVRLVNSGLQAGDGAEEFLRMMENGWRFFLWNLKHCLERHPGVPRVMISARPRVRGTREEVWRRLFGRDGLGEAPGGPGDRFRFALVGGEVLGGATVLSDRPWAFAGMVESFGDGVLHVELEGSGDSWRLGVWLSAYGVAPGVRARVGGALKSTVAGLFGEPGTERPATQR